MKVKIKILLIQCISPHSIQLPPFLCVTCRPVYEHVCRYPGPVCGTRVALRNPRQKGTRVPFSKIYRNVRVFPPIFGGFLLICKLFMTRVNNSANVYHCLMDFIWSFEKMQSAYEFSAHFWQILSNFGWFVTHFLKTNKYSHVWGPGFPHLKIK